MHVYNLVTAYHLINLHCKCFAFLAWDVSLKLVRSTICASTVLSKEYFPPTATVLISLGVCRGWGYSLQSAFRGWSTPVLFEYDLCFSRYELTIKTLTTPREPIGCFACRTMGHRVVFVYDMTKSHVTNTMF